MKYIFQDHIASDDCSFCGTHETCGHYFRAIKEYKFGYEDERGSLVLLNTCGDYSWICKNCWGKIKYIILHT